MMDETHFDVDPMGKAIKGSDHHPFTLASNVEGFRLNGGLSSLESSEPAGRFVISLAGECGTTTFMTKVKIKALSNRRSADCTKAYRPPMMERAFTTNIEAAVAIFRYIVVEQDLDIVEKPLSTSSGQANSRFRGGRLKEGFNTVRIRKGAIKPRALVLMLLILAELPHPRESKEVIAR